MEDAHAFVYDFEDVQGQGFFGIFDGHAGKDAAEWCGQNFHQVSIKFESSSSLYCRKNGVVLMREDDLCAWNSISSKPSRPIKTSQCPTYSTQRSIMSTRS